MCGIVSYIGHNPALPIILEGLHRLEYRGYDSAGIALLRGTGRRRTLDVHKTLGRVAELEAILPKRVAATMAIGHTRWATHGAPSDQNAHPHTDASGKIAIIHNGIIENAAALRQEVSDAGIELRSETDSELFAHLLALQLERSLPTAPDKAATADTLVVALRSVLQRIHGAYGLAVLHQDFPDELIVARLGSPLVLGIGDNQMFAASDVSAIVRHTQQVVYLEDGEIARLTKSSYEITNLHAQSANREPALVTQTAEDYDKENFAHFTLKEIHEQPDVLERVLRGRIEDRFATARLDGLNLSPRDLLGIERIKILGCGSALIAGSIGARMIESLARIPCDAESSAEFRYRNPLIETDTLYFAVSQSGETYDTMAAIEEIQRKGGRVLGIVNSVGSSIARSCGAGAYLHAGAEVAVVSTKTFVATLMMFAMIALLFARTRDLSPAAGAELIGALRALPDQVRDLLNQEELYATHAKTLAQFDHAYFIGRNAGFGVAQEGALKLKEVSYIHAEAYPAAELKHGPLALISDQTPTIAIVLQDDLLAKNLSSIEEIRARAGGVLAISQGAQIAAANLGCLQVPDTHPLLAPILALVPLQFLAYYAALERGCDVDRPRNLAKSVTVE